MPENRRILIVDDEPELRRAYRGFLNPEPTPTFASSRTQAPPAQPQGGARFEILEAESGDRALELVLSELAAGRRLAGAIVDVRMPGKLDGLQLIREAWKADPGLLVVVATAYQDRSVDEIDRIFGPQFQDQWDYLNKPFTQGEIVQKARQLVSSWNRREREKEYLNRIRDQQRQLAAQERLAALGRLARSVGHEFGNVLQPLLTRLELVRRRLVSGQAAENLPALEAMLGEMADAAELGSSICQDLMVFGREGIESSAPYEVPARAPIERALRLLRHDLGKKDVRVELAVAPEHALLCHESRMAQVFVNLLANSLDAVKDGGRIEIRSEIRGGRFEITVRDDGQGISSDILPLVFQPLFTTKGARGNGIGLSVSRQIVAEYGGSISLESEPGKGTTARLSFERGSK